MMNDIAESYRKFYRFLQGLRYNQAVSDLEVFCSFQYLRSMRDLPAEVQRVIQRDINRKGT
jgi:hypothetical protein